MVKLALILSLLLALIVPAHADRQFSLVTPDWVAAHASDPSVRILDVRIDVHQVLHRTCAERGPHVG